MGKYIVTGMSCAACQARVEKAVKAVPGVAKCEVNLLTNSMKVEGSADNSEIIKAVSEAGYGAKSIDDSANQNAGNAGKSAFSAEAEALQNTETPRLVIFF